jgi:hypothetical protein
MRSFSGASSSSSSSSSSELSVGILQFDASVQLFGISGMWVSDGEVGVLVSTLSLEVVVVVGGKVFVVV